MKLLAITFSWLLCLGLSLLILMNSKPMPMPTPMPMLLYWPKADVREVCLGRDSCTIGKFTHYSIPDFAGQTPVIQKAVNPQKETRNAG